MKLYKRLVRVMRFIWKGQYSNDILTYQKTTCMIAVQGHQRSQWAHRAVKLTYS